MEIYPASLSMLPVSVALARFFSQFGFWQLSFLGGLKEYSFWYLGTPYAYLTGPVAPFLVNGLVFLVKDYFFSSLLLSALAQLAFAFGVGVFSYRIMKFDKKKAALVTVLLGFNPWIWVNGWAWAELSKSLGYGLLPWALMVGIIWLNEVERSKLKIRGIDILLIALVVLINISIFYVWLMGMLLWAVILGWQKGDKIVNEAGDQEFRFNFVWIKKVIFASIIGLLIATLWYGGGFWLNLIFSGSSIGGRSIFGAFLWILNINKIFLPAILIVWMVRKQKMRQTTDLWLIGWLGSWLFLSALRFLADWDFWQDWSQYGTEVFFGLSMLVGKLTMSKKSKFILSIAGLVMLFGWTVAIRLKTFWLPRANLAGSVEQKIADWASARKGKWFVSGVPVFWLNVLVPEVTQLRGGVDQGSTNPDWREWAFVLRESRDVELIKEILAKAEIKWVVVHTPESAEFYHDFKNLSVWDKVGERILEDKGDRLYRLD